ncbi:MAG: glutamine-hydrolyzing carbamoyl-phosphate synthase small subunit [Parvularculales bacterium]
MTSNTAVTGMLALADGTTLPGIGFGATGHAVGELCFNTAMTGYQEILTDPSYAGQIIVFTFPHIGNVGANGDDNETAYVSPEGAVRALVVRELLTLPSSHRAQDHLDGWLKERGIIGLSGVDTRALTRRIREQGFANAAIAHEPGGRFDTAAMQKTAGAWPGLEGMELARSVTTNTSYEWDQPLWRSPHDTPDSGQKETVSAPAPHVVAVDYGMKSNILRSLTSQGVRVSVVSAGAEARAILSLRPDGVFLSNGPGDPAATAAYAAPVVREIVDSGVPVFGICLGHQILALALGAKTTKMRQGHHGANHPVKDIETGKVEITSMNHGFTVDRDSLPKNVEETHISLFDGSNCGLRLKDKPVFSVQYHPEASPGPHDSHYLFTRFYENLT